MERKLEKKSAVVLLSGGLDSAITVAYLLWLGHDVKAGVFVNRGQSNFNKEADAARRVAEYFNIPLYNASFSVQDSKSIVPKDPSKKHLTPGRNLILVSLALPFVDRLDCDTLALGNIISDEFPDCNPDFRKKFREAASQALGREIEVVAPLADWPNWDKEGEIHFAYVAGYKKLFEITWTCWSGGETHCGVCEACNGRKEGFKKAGLPDPTIYKDQL